MRIEIFRGNCYDISNPQAAGEQFSQRLPR